MWEPIVDGALGDRVWHAIAAIADALATSADDPATAVDLAVFWTYLATEREHEAERAAIASERFTARLGEPFARPALFGGLAGAGWVAAHVASDAEAALAIVDAQLLALLAPNTWQGEYDLTSGVVGFGVYFLERGDAPAGVRGRELVVAYLAAAAERGPLGATWRTDAALLTARERETWPDGVYDCGVAHGVAGAIGVLARIARRDDAPADAAPLRDEAVRWLAAQRTDAGVPAMVFGARREVARTAWCYGDPGVELAVWDAAIAGDWRGRSAGVTEAGLCHGAAGLLHAANRRWHATGDARDRETALAWLAELLAILDRGVAPGGAIITGTAGIGLALLATVGAVEPAWDRTMLCDLP